MRAFSFGSAINRVDQCSSIAHRNQSRRHEEQVTCDWWRGREGFPVRAPLVAFIGAVDAWVSRAMRENFTRNGILLSPEFSLSSDFAENSVWHW
jgi:hypothetical protein